MTFAVLHQITIHPTNAHKTTTMASLPSLTCSIECKSINSLSIQPLLTYPFFRAIQVFSWEWFLGRDNVLKWRREVSYERLLLLFHIHVKDYYPERMASSSSSMRDSGQLRAMKSRWLAGSRRWILPVGDVLIEPNNVLMFGIRRTVSHSRTR